MSVQKISAIAPSSDKLTPSQLGCILNCISMSSNAMKRLSIMLHHEDDERNVESIYIALEYLSERNGFLADLAAERSAGTCGAVYSHSVLDWMMPESFKEDEEAS